MQESHPYRKEGLLAELLRPKRIVFIVNPKAGTNLQRHIRESVDKCLNHKRFEYGFRFTERAQHAKELAEQSIAEGFQTLEFPDFTNGRWQTRKPSFALDDRY